jgi:hypothetical protein
VSIRSHTVVCITQEIHGRRKKRKKTNSDENQRLEFHLMYFSQYDKSPHRLQYCLFS